MDRANDRASVASTTSPITLGGQGQMPKKLFFYFIFFEHLTLTHVQQDRLLKDKRSGGLLIKFF